MSTIAYSGGIVFSGYDLLEDHCVIFSNGVCTDIVLNKDKPQTDTEVDLCGDIITPGFTDLQVNGGGGVLFNDNPTVNTLQTIANAHRTLGTTSLLPTLITSTPENTEAAIKATLEAVESGVYGISGLHLEGPHLSTIKKGAHDAKLIRPMQPRDLQLLLDTAKKLPVLKVTIAPENVSLEQTQALASAGVLIALGHSNATFETCTAYKNSGVQCVTHLFNAMSQLGSREPGLVGMAMDSEEVKSGLIADGVHVHPASIRSAVKSMGGLHRIYLVSDAMAVAGTSLTSFKLDNRTIHRKDGRLTLQDGTLAGADLALNDAIRFMVDNAGIPLKDTLRSAVTIPNTLLNPTSTYSPIGQPLEAFIKLKSTLTSVEPLVPEL